MGLMQGKVIKNTFYVLDSFALPIIGTETRVITTAETSEWISQLVTQSPVIGRNESCCGWYHSHPGYGPYLSGTDCDTQRMSQKIMEPWLAIVIDPFRTISTGKVELGCF